MSGGTAAPHFSTPRPESTVQWPDRVMLELSTLNAPEKGRKTIEELFKQLLPHGMPDFVTHLWKDEAMDEAIDRIATSEGLEGMYKIYWMLAEKAKGANLETDHKKLLTSKARAAVDKAIHLLAMECNLKKGSVELTVANSTAKRKVQAAMPYVVQTMQTKLLWEFKILPTSKQTQGGKSKEGADKEGSKPTGDHTVFSGKDRSTMEDGIPKRNIAEQLQKCKTRQTSSAIFNWNSGRTSTHLNSAASKMMMPAVTCPKLGERTW